MKDAQELEGNAYIEAFFEEIGRDIDSHTRWQINLIAYVVAKLTAELAQNADRFIQLLEASTAISHY